MATGGRYGDCVVDFIKGDNASDVDLAEDDCTAGATATTFGNNVFLCTEGGSWPAYTALFCEGTEGDQECAVLKLASLLLHELVHLCGSVAELFPDEGGVFGDWLTDE